MKICQRLQQKQGRKNISAKLLKLAVQCIDKTNDKSHLRAISFKKPNWILKYWILKQNYINWMRGFVSSVNAWKYDKGQLKMGDEWWSYYTGIIGIRWKQTRIWSALSKLPLHH